MWTILAQATPTTTPPPASGDLSIDWLPLITAAVGLVGVFVGILVGITNILEYRQRQQEKKRAAAPPVPTPPSPPDTLPTSEAETHTIPNNLPAELSPFIGREKELTAIEDILQRPDVRLVTLTGPGGVGKTRLAQQVAAQLLADPRFSDGVFLVSLTALTDPDLVASTIARTLGLKEAGEEPIAETLKRFLHSKHMLLLLDNFEHLQGGAPVVATLLEAAPQLKLLITSRALLRIAGELEFPVPPLELPNADRLPRLEMLSQYEAIAFFMQRAVAVDPHFTLNSENATAIAQICTRLDGLPLAIELAAARIRLLPPASILDRLSSRLEFLTGGRRDLPARQQTLRAAIDWSYDLLDDPRKRLFRRLAVFAGGSTLAAIEEVCNIGDGPGIDVLDGMEALVSESLVQQTGRPPASRFLMLETLREYAFQKLTEHGEGPALKDRHALYFTTLVEEAEPQLTGSNQAEWLATLEQEHENVRAALGWLTTPQSDIQRENVQSEPNSHGQTALRMSGALWRFWYIRGYPSEGRRWLNAALNASPDELPEGVEGQASAPQLSELASRAKVLTGAGVFAEVQGDYPAARSFFEQSLTLMRKIDDKKGIAQALNNLGIVALHTGVYPTARSLFEQSLAIKRELGDKQAIAQSLTSLGLVADGQGDYRAARSYFEESLALLRETGDKRGIASMLNSLGNVALDQGDYVVARSLFEESLAARHELGDRLGIAYLLNNLGNVAHEQGNIDDAQALYEQSLTSLQELGERKNAAGVLNSLGKIYQERRDFVTAHTYYEESLALRREIGDKPGIAGSLNSLGSAALDQGEYARARALYNESLLVERDLGDKKGIARSLVGLAALEVRAPGETGARRAATVVSAVEALLEAAGTILERMDRKVYERATAAARQALGESAWQQAFSEGRHMSLEQAIAYALGEQQTV